MALQFSYVDWHVGMKVVCVKTPWDTSHPSLAGVVWPVLGETYTIRTMDIARTSYGEGVVIWLEEISNPVVKFREMPPIEVGFAACCFRPVQTRATDISVFTSMLHREPQKVDA